MKSSAFRTAPSIAFLTGQLGLGGAEKQLYLLTGGLINAGWRVSVITLNPGRSDYWEEPLKQLGASLHAVETGLSRARRLAVIADLLRRDRPEIVHSWTHYANLYAAAAGRWSRTPIRIGSERANHYCSREALGRFWYHMNLWGLDRLVVNSEPAAQFLNQYRPQLPVSVVPNAVALPDPRDAPGVERSRAEIRRTFGIGESSCAVAGVGTLVRRKNFDSLIDAVRLLSNRGLDVVLVLIGDGPLRSEIEASAGAMLNRRVFVTGALPNAANWYPAFDVLCLPSLNQEGMPNVLMEASAAELPVVATNAGGVSAVVEHGVTGLVVTLNGPESLATALTGLIENKSLRQQMGRSGRSKMQREFGVDLMVNRMIAVYRTTQAGQSLSSR